MSETASLAAALAAVQAELPTIHKGETAIVPTKNGRYSYSYADLASITRVILPVLGRHGLAWTTMPTVQDGRFVLAYRLMHTSGETLEGMYPLPDGRGPQETGSAITYARRYALCSVTGVAPDDDDDDAAAAQAAHQRRQQQQPAAAPQPVPAPPDPETVRDWALEQDRTAEGLRTAAARLREQWPRTAVAVVTNETGDEELLADLLERKADEIAPRSAPTSTLVAGNGQPAKSREQARRERMLILANECGYSRREDRLTFFSMVVGRDISSSTELRWPREVEAIIAALERHRQKQPEGT